MNTLTAADIASLGDALHAAWQAHQVIEPLTLRHPTMTLDDAYRVQQRMVARRTEQGQRIVGKKVGVTSTAVMDLLGVRQPDFGCLLDGMIVHDGQSVAVDSLIQPKIEGEIAFVMKRDLCGPGLTAADLLAATEGVMACFEVVDSRIRDWQIKIQDTVADNASCGVFVLGDRLVDPRSLDLATVGMVLERNGDVACTGAGAATLGHPVNAMVWLANTLGRLGIPLKAGEVVLSGSLGPMLPVQAGDHLRVSLQGVGGCAARFH